MIKPEDYKFLNEQLRGHIEKAKVQYETALEGVCLRGEDEDLVELRHARDRYIDLVRAASSLVDATLA